MRAPDMTRRRQVGTSHGFSLIELLIVVAIILIIAAIAIPNFMRSRLAANESSGVQSLRNITTANVVYSSTYGMGYASSLAILGPAPGNGLPTSTNAGLIDDVLAAGTKSGYSFLYTPGPPDNGMVNSFQLQANPITRGYTGNRYFFTDESGVIRQNLDSPASATDTPIG